MGLSPGMRNRFTPFPGDARSQRPCESEGLMSSSATLLRAAVPTVRAVGAAQERRGGARRAVLSLVLTWSVPSPPVDAR